MGLSFFHIHNCPVLSLYVFLCDSLYESLVCARRISIVLGICVVSGVCVCMCLCVWKEKEMCTFHTLDFSGMKCQLCMQ